MNRKLFFEGVQVVFFLCHGLAFRAVTVSARIVGLLDMAAIITGFNVASQSSSTAGNNIVHHTKTN